MHFTDSKNKFMIKKHEQIIDKEFDLVFSHSTQNSVVKFSELFPRVFSLVAFPPSYLTVKTK
jgi:hypothetical protein